MTVKKVLLTSALVAGFASVASAHSTPTVTLGGYIDTQVGFRNQDSGYDRLNPATGATAGLNKVHDYALVNDTKLFVNVDGTARNGIKYGGQVTLNADTSDRKTTADKVPLNNNPTFSDYGYMGGRNAYRVMAYVEGMFGRGEAGATTGVYDAMHVNAGSVARATGGVDGDWRFWVHPEINNSAAGTAPELVFNNFITSPSLPSAYDKDRESYANKFNYFTPMWKGFRAGITYVPDTEVNGTIANATGITKDFVTYGGAAAAGPGNYLGFTDVWSGALTWEGQFRQIGINLFAGGELGEAKNWGVTGTPLARHDLEAWEVGGSLSFMNFTVAGSYADWDESGVQKAVVLGDKSSHFWNIGGSFVHGPFGFSVTYLCSERGGIVSAGALTDAGAANELSNLSFGVDYALAPGLMPYAEVSVFELDQKKAAGASVAAKKNDGTIFLIGSKLSF